eukprot:jgi/Bigna1/62704/fgenesh1_kg.40_\
MRSREEEETTERHKCNHGGGLVKIPLEILGWVLWALLPVELVSMQLVCRFFSYRHKNCQQVTSSNRNDGTAAAA